MGAEPTFPSQIRSCAVEVLLSCCEAAPAAMRRVKDFARAFLGLCMELAASGEEDMQEWDEKMVRVCAGASRKGEERGEERG